MYVCELQLLISVNHTPFVKPAVARGRSLFGDPAAEIQELTQIIKQDIAKINTDISTLQELSKTRSYRDSRQVRSHSGAVVISLRVRGRVQLLCGLIVVVFNPYADQTGKHVQGFQVSAGNENTGLKTC